jgi:hypothetical protein
MFIPLKKFELEVRHPNQVIQAGLALKYQITSTMFFPFILG